MFPFLHRKVNNKFKLSRKEEISYKLLVEHSEDPDSYRGGK